ncbi:hypothetical protein OG559_26405 [Micromonospora sp. NBC_01405]|uniref:hypothetical protein n=1 Tax=Micromonospora sp. NBC_01405 TaxID=2903589 RepID=UPI00324D7BBA
MSFRQPDRPGRHPAGWSESDRLLDAAHAARDAAAPRPDRAAQDEDDAAARRDRAADREDAAGPGRPAGDPLAQLLAAAAGPTRPGELAGEEAALAAFRAARVAPASAPARTPRRLTVGVVAWIGALAATATAGVAVAAATLDRTEEPAPPPAPPAASASPEDPDAAGPTAPRPTGSGPGRSPSPIPAPTATPSGAGPSGPARPGTPGTGTRSPDPGHSGAGAQLPGLCRAYLAKSAAQRERALEKPGFAPLVTAAGGADEVESFCQDLLAGADSGRVPTARPSHPGRPDRIEATGETPDAAKLPS